MGKGPKNNNKKSYTSKGGLGGRVGRKIRNMLRRARRSGELVDDQVLRGWHDREKYWRELSTRRDQASKDRYTKWAEEQRIKLEASKLYRTYKPAGCTYSACVQALKTNWMTQFTEKWKQRLSNERAGDTIHGRPRRRSA